MDRNYFYHKHAEEKQKEISKELATRHLLRETGHEGEGASYSLRVGHTYADTTGMYGPDSLTRELQYVGHPHIGDDQIDRLLHGQPRRLPAVRAGERVLPAQLGHETGQRFAGLHFVVDD